MDSSSPLHRDELANRPPVMLFVVLGVCLAVGVVLASWMPPTSAALGAWIDLSDAAVVEIRDASGRPVLTGEFRTRIDALGNIEKDAALTDRVGRAVVGEVEIEIPGPEAATPEQELEIDIIRIAPQGSFSAYIDDREVAKFITDDRGSVDVELRGVPE